MRILAGDIGGTKTIIAVVVSSPQGVTVEVERRYESRAYGGLWPIVESFLQETGAQVERAGFGIAGPVVDNCCDATNLPWIVDGNALGQQLGCPTLLFNDFEAAAYGVLATRETDLVEINPGLRIARAPIAVLGAGTGLGEAFLFWAGDRYHVVPSEGGHADFAPRNELEMGLLRWLLKRHRRVSWERVVSGGLGLPNIYQYLREEGVVPESAAVAQALSAGADPGVVIGTHAVAGTDPLCEATVNLFASAYGAEAGNLALKVIARGGVFVAGGVAAKVLPRIQAGGFRAAYLDKGRLSPLVETIPVYVVTNPRLGMFGAALATVR